MLPLNAKSCHRPTSSNIQTPFPSKRFSSPTDPLRQPFTRPSQSPLPSTKPPIPLSNQAHPPIKSAIPFSSKPSEPPSKSPSTSLFHPLRSSTPNLTRTCFRFALWAASEPRYPNEARKIIVSTKILLKISERLRFFLGFLLVRKENFVCLRSSRLKFRKDR